MEKWTTKDEIRHLEDCGSGKWHKERKPAISRDELLRGYRQAALKRRDWDDMDREKVMEALDRIMAGEGNGEVGNE